MANVFFFLVVPFFMGLALHWLLVLLYKVGLGFITRFFYRGVFISDDTLFRQDILWNKPQIRFMLALLPCQVLGVILATLLTDTVTDSSFLRLTMQGTAGAFVAFTSYINFRGKKKAVTTAPAARRPGNGFVLQTSGGSTIEIDNPTRGIFICGGAGSGKSKSIIEPIIQQSGQNGFTGLVYDFKFPVLASEVNGAYQGSQVKTWFVNFTDLAYSHQINPVSPKVITNASYAREAAKTILSNIDFKASQKRDFWIQSSEAILTSAIWYLRNNHPQYCTLPHVIALVLKHEPKELIRLFQQDLQVKAIIASVASGSESENQLAGVFASIQNYLSTLATPEIFWVLSGDEVPLDLNNPENPGILTVGNDPTLSATLSPVISLIVSMAAKQMNQQGKEKSIILLDEAPTLFIPNFQQIPSTARSNKIATVYSVQDIAQMQGMIGREETEMIISNLGTQFYGRSTNIATAERISKLFGKMDVEYTGSNKSRSNDRNSYGQSTTIQQRERLTPSQVLGFRAGEFCGIVAEGNTSEFQDILREQTSVGQPLQKIRTAPDINATYTRINNDLHLII
ncbi:type IV secretory system conjugative DNA transfer family protein [Dyadobacter bucti]|jgi:type IV secretory pathway TraG/TraD family ATPase VirD4|uniref:type IV secretory system conjugative DNA transfer family protein n=1 Tax=Dyadobacter bucti TaxID=2572203 RepID=UPI00110921B8|nr:type IV secretory system conjugative DNA transfer family protein [Dyadobacter bucti]